MSFPEFGEEVVPFLYQPKFPEKQQQSVFFCYKLPFVTTLYHILYHFCTIPQMPINTNTLCYFGTNVTKFSYTSKFFEQNRT